MCLSVLTKWWISVRLQEEARHCPSSCCRHVLGSAVADTIDRVAESELLGAELGGMCSDCLNCGHNQHISCAAGKEVTDDTVPDQTLHCPS